MMGGEIRQLGEGDAAQQESMTGQAAERWQLLCRPETAGQTGHLEGRTGCYCFCAIKELLSRL